VVWYSSQQKPLEPASQSPTKYPLRRGLRVMGPGVHLGRTGNIASNTCFIGSAVIRHWAINRARPQSFWHKRVEKFYGNYAITGYGLARFRGLALRPLETQTASTFTNEEHFQPLNNASKPFSSAPAHSIGGKTGTRGSVRCASGLMQIAASPTIVKTRNCPISTVDRKYVSVARIQWQSWTIRLGMKLLSASSN